MTGSIRMAALVAVLAACGPAAEPRFDAACAPTESLEDIKCTIRNNGTKAGHACITARVQPAMGGPPMIARRMCTAVLAPGEASEVTPPFEQLDRVRRGKTLASRCLRGTKWTCKVDVVESPREMAGLEP